MKAPTAKVGINAAVAPVMNVPWLPIAVLFNESTAAVIMTSLTNMNVVPLPKEQPPSAYLSRREKMARRLFRPGAVLHARRNRPGIVLLINKKVPPSPLMEYLYIEVRGGKIRDCVNVVFRGFSAEEVERLLRRLGWIDVLAGHDATLLGRPPVVQLQYPVVLEFLRYHIRLFQLREGEVVGNVHYNGIALQLQPPDLHRSDHAKGAEFLRRQLEGLCSVRVERSGECNILVIERCLNSGT